MQYFNWYELEKFFNDQDNKIEEIKKTPEYKKVIAECDKLIEKQINETTKDKKK